MKAHLIALATVFVWGITFVSTKVLLADFTPVEILFTRFFVGFAALWVLRPRVLRVQKRSHEALLALAGLLGVALYYLLENVALVYTNASNVGVIVAVSPLFAALLARRVSMRFFAGFVLAMAGIVLVSASTSFGNAGDLLALAAALVWALYSTLVKRLSDLGYETITTTKRTFAWGLVFVFAALVPQLIDGSLNPGALLEPLNAANMLFLGLIASAACFVSWGYAVAHLGTPRASAYIYLVPVITMAASVAVLGEPFTLQAAFGMALTIGGLVLSARS